MAIKHFYVPYVLPPHFCLDGILLPNDGKPEHNIYMLNVDITRELTNSQLLTASDNTSYKYLKLLHTAKYMVHDINTVNCNCPM